MIILRNKILILRTDIFLQKQSDIGIDNSDSSTSKNIQQALNKDTKLVSEVNDKKAKTTVKPLIETVQTNTKPKEPYSTIKPVTIKNIPTVKSKVSSFSKPLNNKNTKKKEETKLNFKNTAKISTMVQVICGNEVCHLHYKLLEHCTIYLPTDVPDCEIPCVLTGCRRHEKHAIRCPIWECFEMNNSTTTTDAPTTTTTTTIGPTTITTEEPIAPTTLVPPTNSTYMEVFCGSYVTYGSLVLNFLLVVLLLTWLIVTIRRCCKKRCAQRRGFRQSKNDEFDGISNTSGPIIRSGSSLPIRSRSNFSLTSNEIDTSDPLEQQATFLNRPFQKPENIPWWRRIFGDGRKKKQQGSYEEIKPLLNQNYDNISSESEDMRFSMRDYETSDSNVNYRKKIQESSFMKTDFSSKVKKVSCPTAPLQTPTRVEVHAKPQSMGSWSSKSSFSSFKPETPQRKSSMAQPSGHVRFSQQPEPHVSFQHNEMFMRTPPTPTDDCQYEAFLNKDPFSPVHVHHDQQEQEQSTDDQLNQLLQQDRLASNIVKKPSPKSRSENEVLKEARSRLRSSSRLLHDTSKFENIELN